MRDVEHEAIKRMMEEAERTGADSLLRTKPLEWIMCNEKLPEDGELVIAATCDQVYVCRFDEEVGFVNNTNGKPVEVGVWLRAPEPPKPEMVSHNIFGHVCAYECNYYSRNGERWQCGVGTYRR